MTEESQYSTPEQAREQWSRDHGLPVAMAPRYPKGTREYAEYSKELATELDKFASGE